MQIEDAELRDLFRSASQEELAAMRDGVAAIEAAAPAIAASDDERVKSMLQRTHSMKGSAAMLGLKDIATLARQWEELARNVTRGEVEPVPATIATLHKSLEAIAALVDEAVTGNPSGVQTFYVLAQLMSPTATIVPGNSDSAGKTGDGETTPAAEEPSEAVAESSEESTPDESIAATEVAAADPTERDIANPPTPTQTPARTPNLAPSGPPTRTRAPAAAPTASTAHFIDDDELRDTFRIASADHLEALDAGLLHLEQHPDDAARLDAVLREIHSIKGDSGMLGVEALVPLAHAWEQQLIPVKEGRVELTSELCDRLALGLDRIRDLVNQATEGTPIDFEIATAIGELEAPGSATAALASRADADRADEVDRADNADNADNANNASETDRARMDAADTAPAPVTEYINTGEVAPSRPDLVEEMTRQALGRSNHEDGAYHIDTIRVATSHLDVLLTQVGELTVSKSRIAHRMTEIAAIATQCETLHRKSLSNRFAWDGMRDLKLGREETLALQRVQAYHQQTEERIEQLTGQIDALQTAIGEDTARLETVASELEDGIQTLRLLPLSTIFNLYPRMVRDLARSQGKNISFQIEGGETLADKRVLEEMKDPLMHIIRNAIDHGIETPEERRKRGKPERASLILRGYQAANSIAIEVSDDGRGLDLGKIRQTALKRNICRPEDLDAMTPTQIQSLIFMPGFSTRSFVTEVSGRGVGLDVVHANVERLKGNITLDSEAGRGCTMRLELGSMLSTTHVLLVELNQTPYAIPVEYIRSTMTLSPDEIFLMENRETVLVDNRPVSLSRLGDLLGLPHAVTLNDRQFLACVILSVDGELLAVVVDRSIDQQDALLKPQSKLLRRVRNVSGATILGTGEVCMVLHPPDLIESVRGTVTSTAAIDAPRTTKLRVLLAEDSIATRTQEKRILEAAGYEVTPAVDGLDALNKLQGDEFDAIVSDVQMPNLDGLQLTARIRQNSRHTELPIVLVTSLATEEDRRRGAEAGANAYITKSSFNQAILIETLNRLI